MSVTRKRLAAGTAGAVVAVLTLLTLSGCGGGSADEGEKVPETATGSLEQLASEVGCKPVMQTDADEIRQAICKNTDGDFDGKFILATFATDRGQAEWLSGAKDYGGHYLVGRKWVAVGETKAVKSLYSRLGGTIEEGVSHGSAEHGSSEGGSSEGGSSHSGHDG
ncbi:hypothetical protein SGFS_083600 [Streptomyces graminofaciens]|uniref:Lipoprotein n=1 Tax=Streptomyces graminofaciens TaxID=68212 RepID=A0ABN5VY87_9ACTN|nr:hypothetical protein [Streptomyces graminofaciens]BBC37066.1 hypothetical protein SGFS_083600 [Streptomyces graminofaciens]